jgi:SAM-dependent methyltransferase
MSNVNTSDQWFASWFDTPYYHILYRDRDYTEAGAFMQRLTQRLKLDENAHIMDLACGRGRHSMYLNQLGYRVTGVDLSDSSIAFAKAELRKAVLNDSTNEESSSLPPIDTSRIEFHVHNMTLAYDQIFDAVFNLFTSFGYFDDAADNLRTVMAIKENLKPGGYGVIDFMNVNYVIKNLVAQNSKTEAGITFHNTRRFENGFIYKEIEFRDNDHDYHFTERVSALTLEDFQSYFAASGLDLIDIYGNYKMDDYNPETSERLIMIFRN